MLNIVLENLLHLAHNRIEIEFAFFANFEKKKLYLCGLKSYQGMEVKSEIYGAYPTHPGEVLKDEIEERGISQRQLAESMGLTYSVVNEILNAKSPLTAKTALMFEAALDVPADSLMYLQMKYNMQTARKDSSILDMLKNIRKVAGVL